MTNIDGNCLEYCYLPDGTKLGQAYNTLMESVLAPLAEERGLSADVSGGLKDSLTHTDRPGLLLMGYKEYSGNVIYKDGKLDKVLFPGGYCTFGKDGSNPTFHYFTQDYLGNNRAVVNEDGTVEQITHYYPFGGTFNDAGINPELQQYKYNGKELNRTLGLDSYDYGARQYFPALPTWDRVDPLCEKDYQVNPYAYCRNNPVRMFDNDGKRPGDFFLTMDAAAIDFGLFYNDNSIRENREYGTFIYKVTNQSGVSGYSYSFATIGDLSTIESSALPNGHIPAATVHTHGASTAGKSIEYYDNEFSGVRKGENEKHIKNQYELIQTSVYDIG